MKKLITLLITVAWLQLNYAQTLTGTLKHHVGQQISLTGFNYYDSYELAKATIDSLGNFTLNYPKDYKGMGILKTQDNSSLVIVLTEPNIVLKGTHLKEADSLFFTKSKENPSFVVYAKAQGIREASWAALKYLQPLYQEQKELQSQTKFAEQITKEIKRLVQVDKRAIDQLDKPWYVRWFIPFKKLVNDMPKTVRKYPERLPQNIQQFRNIDFNNQNFKTSGLFKQLIEGHYMLLENMGQSLDSVYTQMNVSTKYLIENLSNNDELLNTVSEELFNYFEKRSLFKASEYLAVTMLTKNQCSVNDDLANKFEAYRKLKVGNIAPDVQLTATKKLSDIKTNKLVVFGASWCPHCKTDAIEIEKLYKTWQQHNTEVVYISIDEDEKEFNAYYNTKPWQTYCDFKGWDTQAAKDYYVTGTPSYFLLDANNKILVRPNTVLHANVWITQKL